jgi:hypothetical protein
MDEAAYRRFWRGGTLTYMPVDQPVASRLAEQWHSLPILGELCVGQRQSRIVVHIGIALGGSGT